MKIWEDTVKTALVGSERQALSLNLPSGSPLGTLISQLDTAPPEAYLLKVAGVLTAYRRASWSPSSASQIHLDPCDLDDRPLCSERAQQLLGMILEGTHREVLPEWLRLATQAGQRVSEDLLPTLLDHGRQSRGIRDQILPVLGKRGHWLASHNRAWEYACGSETLDPNEWQTGSSQQRLALLKQFSHQDPQQVRQWIQTTWKTDPADFRSTCLQILGETLSAEDEPWLTEILTTDRSKQVRAEAAELLSRLPGSALCQRMRERVDPLLSLTRSGKGDPRLEITLPSEFTPEMEQDGIQEKPESRSGQKAWWLLEMLARIPPQEWCERWELSIESLLQAIDPKWIDLCLEAWGKAAYRFQDPDWVQPLLTMVWHLEEGAQKPVHQLDRQGSQRVRDLVSLLPGDQLQSFCVAWLQSEPDSFIDSWILQFVLYNCQTPWNSELTRQFTNACRQGFRSGQPRADYLFRSNLLHYGLYMHPDHRQQIRQDLERAFAKNYYYLQAVEDLTSLLDFRQQIHQSFS